VERREGRVPGGLATVCRLAVGVGKDTATATGIDLARIPLQGKAGVFAAVVTGQATRSTTLGMGLSAPPRRGSR
jgi:hypothetical protein